MDQMLKDSIQLLTNLVKESHIKGQMHIDFSLAPAESIEEYKNALIACRSAVNNKVLTETELKELLGLL